MEKEIEILEELIEYYYDVDYDACEALNGKEIEAINSLIQAYKEQQAELKKLRKKNTELLRKLKNRVKEVKKLTKYSLYKKEFSRLNEQIRKKDKIINKALEIAFQYAQIDGDHHKAWVIDQIVRCLTGEDYTEWVNYYEYDEETGDEYTWSEGIAP